MDETPVKEAEAPATPLEELRQRAQDYAANLPIEPREAHEPWTDDDGTVWTPTTNETDPEELESWYEQGWEDPDGNVWKGSTEEPGYYDTARPPRIDRYDLWSRLLKEVEEHPLVGDPAFKVQAKRHEHAYIWKCLRNKHIDEWREHQRYYKRHESLDARQEANRKAEAEDEEAPYPDPRARDTDDPLAALIEAEERDAENQKVRAHLQGLPPKLAVLAYCLMRVNGNVSELARRLGQPQRHTARQIERIRAHLQGKGLGA